MINLLDLLILALTIIDSLLISNSIAKVIVKIINIGQWTY
jgi:hypothetical protein